MSTPAPPTLLHSAFYRFVPLVDPHAAAEVLRTLAQGLHGSIVVASEGLNATVAGEARAVAAFESALQGRDVLAGALQGMAFKHSPCAGQPFGRLKVGVKPEIVASASRGSLQGYRLVEAVPDDVPGHWRAEFDLDVEGEDPVEMRMFLQAGGQILTETWLFQYHPY